MWKLEKTMSRNGEFQENTRESSKREEEDRARVAGKGREHIGNETDHIVLYACTNV